MEQLQEHLSELGVVIEQDVDDSKSKVGFRRIAKREEE